MEEIQDYPIQVWFGFFFFSWNILCFFLTHKIILPISKLLQELSISAVSVLHEVDHRFSPFWRVCLALSSHNMSSLPLLDTVLIAFSSGI